MARNDFKVTFNGKRNLGEAFEESAIKGIIKNNKNEFRRAKRDMLTKVGERVANNIKRNQLSGQALQVKSGKLRKSIYSKLEGEDKVYIRSDVYYAAIHDQGGSGFYQVPIRTERRDTVFKKKVNMYTRTVRAHPKRVVAKKKNFVNTEIRRAIPYINQYFTKQLREFIIGNRV